MTTLVELYKNSKSVQLSSVPVVKKQSDLNEIKSIVDQIQEQMVLINQQIRDTKVDLEDSKGKSTVFKQEFNGFVSQYNENSKALQDVLLDLSSRVAKVESV